jgi:hypothetical protein
MDFSITHFKQSLLEDELGYPVDLIIEKAMRTGLLPYNVRLRLNTRKLSSA